MIKNTLMTCPLMKILPYETLRTSYENLTKLQQLQYYSTKEPKPEKVRGPRARSDQSSGQSEDRCITALSNLTRIAQ